MSDFESIVRPFQRRVVSLPSRIFDATDVVAADVTLQFGIEGKTKLFNESFSQRTTTFAETQAEELSRETKTKRIENPNDSSQFVDVELIKKITIEQGEGKDYQKITTKLNNDG